LKDIQRLRDRAFPLQCARENGTVLDRHRGTLRELG
jgi:hypothetical protein